MGNETDVISLQKSPVKFAKLTKSHDLRFVFHLSFDFICFLIVFKVSPRRKLFVYTKFHFKPISIKLSLKQSCAGCTVLKNELGVIGLQLAV